MTVVKSISALALLTAVTKPVPMGPADKYDVLTAPGPQQRLAVLREAVETVTAMVRFQLPEGQ